MEDFQQKMIVDREQLLEGFYLFLGERRFFAPAATKCSSIEMSPRASYTAFRFP